jgi:hypothetical protein
MTNKMFTDLTIFRKHLLGLAPITERKPRQVHLNIHKNIHKERKRMLIALLNLISTNCSFCSFSLANESNKDQGFTHNLHSRKY